MVKLQTANITSISYFYYCCCLQYKNIIIVTVKCPSLNSKYLSWLCIYYIISEWQIFLGDIYFWVTFHEVLLHRGSIFFSRLLTCTVVWCQRSSSSWELLTHNCEYWNAVSSVAVIVNNFFICHLGSTVYRLRARARF